MRSGSAVTTPGDAKVLAADAERVAGMRAFEPEQQMSGETTTRVRIERFAEGARRIELHLP